MSRIPRNALDTSFFHIIVQGINKEYIFQQARYKNMYRKLLKEYKDDYNIKIIAYCIMDNHAHILIYTEKISNMSKFVHKINTQYAQYYNYFEKRVGYVFRNRYQSEPIYRYDYLLRCISYIHHNPVKVNIVKNCVEYKYSSYKEYVNKKEIIDADSIKLAFGDSNYMPTFRWIHKEDEYFSDIEVDNSKRIEKYIMNYEKDKDICIEQVKQNKEKMKELLEYVRNKNWGKKITNKEIAKALQMNERTLRRRIQS